MPLTAAEVSTKLAAEGFLVTERDTEALLRDLALQGDIVEIDAAAGFRWEGHVVPAA